MTASLVTGVLATSIDDRLGTMARFFLVAVAVVAPAAWFWRRRHAGPADDLASSPDAPGAGPPPGAEAPRDLRWLVAAIDAVPERATHEAGDSIELAVPTDLAVAVWGTGSRRPDPVSATVVADALRRRGVRVDALPPDADRSGLDEVVVTLRSLR